MIEKLWCFAVLLILTAISDCAGDVIRDHPCDLESGLCGWLAPVVPQGEAGLATGATPPPLGPPRDANPGTEQGTYYYFSAQGLAQDVRVLVFPTLEHVCRLSFAFYALGPLDLSVLRENIGSKGVVIDQPWNSSESRWEVASLNFSLSDLIGEYGRLVLDVSEFDLGEAIEEVSDYDIFLAVDDINVTLCLPCDYDLLSRPGNLILTGPQMYNLSLGGVDEIVLEAESPICPEETFVFEIESVQPSSLLPVFTINTITGIVSVDATGPHLDANGTTGSLHVSVHVLGSNYTHTTAPHKQTIVVPFYQPPTIQAQAPIFLDVDASAPLYAETAAISALSSQPLRYGNLKTSPEGLASDLTLNETSGEVGGRVSVSTIAAILDLITPAKISVTITDEFGGFVVHTIIINILDSPPVFDQLQYTFTIQESLNSELLGTFALIDPNGDPINQLPHFVNSTASNYFLIIPDSQVAGHSATYNVFGIQAFDFEERTAYYEQIEVSDGLRVSRVAMRVDVLPVNEYPPVISPESEDLKISDVSPVGDEIARFTATDSDHGADGDVTFSITGGNEDQFFELVSPTNATVRVGRSPILPHTYRLIVMATDRGSPPRSAEAVLEVEVIASEHVDCSLPQNGPPHITDYGGTLSKLVGTDLQLDCHYTSNPPARIHKWTFIPPNPQLDSFSIVEGGSQRSEHFTVWPQWLIIHNATVSDAGFYQCNVTNPCSSDLISYHLVLTDYPLPPTNVQVVDGPHTQSVSLTWDHPGQDPEQDSLDDFVIRPVEGFTIQARAQVEVVGGTFATMVVAGGEETFAQITGLLPGTAYDVRVLSTNEAGATPSDAIAIRTNATTPKLRHLVAAGLPNSSILVEWQLEFTGGHPVSEFVITVEALPSRSLGSSGKETRRQAPDVLTFHLDPERAESGSLVTGTLGEGRGYSVRARLVNEVGEREAETNAHLGPTDSTSCSFLGSSEADCTWQLDRGGLLRADETAPPLPAVDSTQNPQGYYIHLSVDGSVPSESTIMSYPAAGYVCDLSFDYQLIGDGELLLTTPSGDLIWLVESSEFGGDGEWIHISLSGYLGRGLRYLTGQLDDVLQFVLVSHGNGEDGQSVEVVLDSVELVFCLPCDFGKLNVNENFLLSLPNSTNIYLRLSQALPIQATLRGCDYAQVEFSVERVVPSGLMSSFAITGQSGWTAAVEISAISEELAKPRTVGFVEVTATIADSDYKLAGNEISRSGLVEFVLVETKENCSFAKSCDFETGSCDWDLGTGAEVVSGPFVDMNTGAYVYTSLSLSSPSDPTVASTAIRDDYCAVSFRSSSEGVELSVIVDGLGSVWSSLTVDDQGVGSSWLDEVALIDLESVAVLANRRLSFVASLAEGGSGYVALDDITLHPCIDCNTPEVEPTSCLPGYYFSLLDESCVVCPPGYFCPTWRSSPQPCPQGTYSSKQGAVTNQTCQTCPPNTFSLVPGASAPCSPCPYRYSCPDPASCPSLCSAGFECPEGELPQQCSRGTYSFEGQGVCQSCPEGFSCEDPSKAPVTCPTGQTSSAGSTSCEASTAVIGGAVGAAGLLLVLVVCCCLCSWCYLRWHRGKLQRGKRERDHLWSDNRPFGGSASASSAASSIGKRWNTRSRGASTILSFLSEDSLSRDPYGDHDPSWADTVQLTTPSPQGKRREGGGREEEGETLRNPMYEEASDEEEQEDMIELGDGWQSGPAARFPGEEGLPPSNSQF